MQYLIELETLPFAVQQIVWYTSFVAFSESSHTLAEKYDFTMIHTIYDWLIDDPEYYHILIKRPNLILYDSMSNQLARVSPCFRFVDQNIISDRFIISPKTNFKTYNFLQISSKNLFQENHVCNWCKSQFLFQLMRWRGIWKLTFLIWFKKKYIFKIQNFRRIKLIKYLLQDMSN